jgi:hypothetical protein
VDRIAVLKDKIASSKTRIAQQNEEKQRILNQIYASPAEWARRASVCFIHRT